MEPGRRTKAFRSTILPLCLVSGVKKTCVGGFVSPKLPQPGLSVVLRGPFSSSPPVPVEICPGPPTRRPAEVWG